MTETEAGRPTPGEPDAVPFPAAPGPGEDRRLPPLYATLFYAIPAALAWAWLRWARPGRSRELWAPSDWPADLAAGAAAGLAIVALCWVAGRHFLWTRRLEAEFGRFLGEQGKGEIAWLALVSGCAEEYFFRGAMQEQFGIWIAAAVFAAVHWPIHRGLLPWPFLAGAIGLALGGLREWTDSLVAPAAAHVLINGINLLRITRRFAAWDEAEAEAYVKGLQDWRKYH